MVDLSFVNTELASLEQQLENAKQTFHQITGAKFALQAIKTKLEEEEKAVTEKWVGPEGDPVLVEALEAPTQGPEVTSNGV